jgi:hypothetical protein
MQQPSCWVVIDVLLFMFAGPDKLLRLGMGDVFHQASVCAYQHCVAANFVCCVLISMCWHAST